MGTFETILGNVGVILAFSWQDSGASCVHLGAYDSKVEEAYLIESFDGALTLVFAS